MRIFTILSILFYSVVLYGQNKEYEVYKLEVPVHIKVREANTWSGAKEGDLLAYNDSVRIGKGGHIKIRNIYTNLVYFSNTQKGDLVIDIRNKAQKQAEKIFSAECAQLKTSRPNIESEMGNEGGVSYRGTTDSLVDIMVQTIVSIGKNIRNNTLYYDSGIQLIAHEVDGVVDFSMVNHTNTDYCVNVLLCDTAKKKVSLCYMLDSSTSDLPYLILPARETLDLPMWQFAAPSSDETYILIATKYLYDASLVQGRLRFINWDDVPETNDKNGILTIVLQQ